MTGDGSITARVVSQTNTNAWAKAGVMFRETLATGSTNAFVPLTPANGVVFQGRPTTGGSSTTFNYGPLVAAPYWVRLVRAGSTFTASISPDGTTWSRSRPDHDQHGFPDLSSVWPSAVITTAR